MIDRVLEKSGAMSKDPPRVVTLDEDDDDPWDIWIIGKEMLRRNAPKKYVCTSATKCFFWSEIAGQISGSAKKINFTALHKWHFSKIWLLMVLRPTSFEKSDNLTFATLSMFSFFLLSRTKSWIWEFRNRVHFYINKQVKLRYHQKSYIQVENQTPQCFASKKKHYSYVPKEKNISNTFKNARGCWYFRNK